MGLRGPCGARGALPMRSFPRSPPASSSVPLPLARPIVSRNEGLRDYATSSEAPRRRRGFSSGSPSSAQLYDQSPSVSTTGRNRHKNLTIRCVATGTTGSRHLVEILLTHLRQHVGGFDESVVREHFPPLHVQPLRHLLDFVSGGPSRATGIVVV